MINISEISCCESKFIEIKLMIYYGITLDILFKKTDVVVDSFVKLSSALDFKAANAKTRVG